MLTTGRMRATLAEKKSFYPASGEALPRVERLLTARAGAKVSLRVLAHVLHLGNEPVDPNGSALGALEKAHANDTVRRGTFDLRVEELHLSGTNEADEITRHLARPSPGQTVSPARPAEEAG